MIIKLPIEINGSKGWTMSDEHSQSSYGMPVLVSPEGTPYGPNDTMDDGNLARQTMMGYVQYLFEDCEQTDSARALDAMVAKFDGVPWPSPHGHR